MSEFNLYLSIGGKQNAPKGTITLGSNTASGKLDQHISEAEAGKAIADASIADLQTRMTSAEGSISTANTNIAQNAADIQSISLAVTSIDAATDNNAQSIISINSSLDNLNSVIANINAEIASIGAAAAGAFVFKGSVASLDDIDEEPRAGYVYQVNDKEYAYNGNEFVELGFNIDLSNYATVASVEAVQTALENKAGKDEIPSLTTIENDIESIKSGKADKTVVEAALAGKANIADVNAALASKANANDVTTALASKANTDDVETALSSKADADHDHDSVYVKKTEAFSGSYADLTDKPTIPSIEGLASEEYVASAVSGKAESFEVDELRQELASTNAQISIMKAYIESLHASAPADPQSQAIMNAAVNNTAYVVPASSNTENIDINVPLTNSVNVVATSNVNISADLIASSTLANQAIITASDKVTVGEE